MSQAIRRGLRIAGLAVAAAVLIPASGAEAATQFKIKSAKHKDGPYHPFSRVDLDPGETKTAWFRVETKLNHDNKVAFSDDDTDYHGYKVTWLRHGTEDATDEVTDSDGLRFNLEPGQPKHFGAVIKRKPSSDPEACIIGRVSDESPVEEAFAYVGANSSCVSG